MNLETEFQIKQLSRAQSHKFGITKFIKMFPVSGNENKAFLVITKGTNNSFAGGALTQGGSVSKNPQQAYLATLAEHLERYSLGFIPSRLKILRDKSYQELLALGEKAIGPQEITLFSEFQYRLSGFPYIRFEPNRPIDWILSQDVVTQKAIWIPLAITVFGSVKVTRRIAAASSNGTGAGWTQAQARVSAAFELVERDSFCLHWWAKTPMAKINLWNSTDPEINLWLQENPEINPRQHTFLLAKTDLDFYSVFVVRTSKLYPKEPAFLTFGACDLDIFTALKKAYRESVQGLIATRNKKLTLTQPWDCDFDNNIKDFIDGTYFYYRPEAARLALDILVGSESVSIDDFAPLRNLSFEEKLEGIVDFFRQSDKPLCFLDMATRDVKKIGLCVEKCLSPSLIELNSSHRTRRWGGNRIFDFAKLHGRGHLVKTIEDLNPLPHPYP